jgi:hypothetical protein
LPDFLSRPWDADLPDMGLHALSHPRVEKSSTLASLGVQDQPHIVLLPVCDDHIAVFHDGRAFSLPIDFPAAQETAELAVQRVVKATGGLESAVISYVGSRGSVELWRADVPTDRVCCR